MPDTSQIRLLEFAEALHALGLVPPLTSAQGRYLEALDGTSAPLEPRERVATVRQAGRRYLRDLVAAHTLASGHTVHLTAANGRDVTRARDDIVRLASAYRHATGTPPRHGALAALLTIHAPDPKEPPTCPGSTSASSAPPAPPHRPRSSAATAAG